LYCEGVKHEEDADAHGCVGAYFRSADPESCTHCELESYDRMLMKMRHMFGDPKSMKAPIANIHTPMIPCHPIKIVLLEK